MTTRYSINKTLPTTDLICFSHLRWNFVFQRPQHLLTRCAKDRRVFFVEEPEFGATTPRLKISRDSSGVYVVVPQLPEHMAADLVVRAQQSLVDHLIASQGISSYILWYYTPMAMPFSRHLKPLGCVYDCMDELSGFAGAPAGLKALEHALLASADVVFTGGQTLYESKRSLHPNVHAFPSSVDVGHFARARTAPREPDDQAPLPGPRLGFFGVIDERLDIGLVAQVAKLRPDWHFVLVGPVVKIDPGTLPQGGNLHYLGPKDYLELPDYISGWDVALLPFARNEATRFISPTKTPEYLAAGRPVVSTSIRDVVHPYGDLGLAKIADTPADFVAAIAAALAEPEEPRQRAASVFLARMSWDATWEGMWDLVEETIARRSTDDGPSLSSDPLPGIAAVSA
ncbi:MAG: glycosyltransferase family 1 protein [Acidobacteriota bacterium]